MLREVPLVVLDEHEDVVADGVASPALELLALDDRGLDVLGVVDGSAGLSGHEEEVVRVRGPADRGEEVVAEHVVLRPRVVVADLIRVVLRIGVHGSVDAAVERVQLPAVQAIQVGGSVVWEVAREPLGAADQGDLLSGLQPHRGPVRARVLAEEVVEAPVLHHQVDHPLDGPLRVDRRCGVGDLRDRPTAGTREQRRPRNPHRGAAQELATG